MDTSQQPKERPILFSAPMVRAILDGRKTVTRRPVKGSALKWLEEFVPEFVALSANELCPFGQIGARLWVRETWYCDHFEVQKGPYLQPADIHDLDQSREDGELVYAADGLAPYEQEHPTWKPSIHMPRWACRILLEITDVRVERLQDGEGETAFESRYVAEGINRIHQGDGEYAFHPFKSEPGPGSWTDPFDAWRELWVSVNGADSWNANPWVWVVEFKRVTP
ncbi:hypothetical protein [Pseudomonas atacamensis]|uniref:hypothetical protein n=1 Tax=Pseudomonas atacamensis TaxID=2565368 RepID=UPI00300ED5E4